MDGNLVKWQKWEFRVGFNYREGLVLHDLGYSDGGKLRPVLHRASLVEMAVPYADPRRGPVQACISCMATPCMSLLYRNFN